MKHNIELLVLSFSVLYYYNIHESQLHFAMEWDLKISLQRSECGLRDTQYHFHEFFSEEMKRKNEEEETKE